MNPVKRIGIGLALWIAVIATAQALTPSQRVVLFGGGKPRLTLSNATVPSSATVGTVVGALAVIGGKGSYTFTLTSNPGGLFSVSGSNLQVAASLTAGSDPITVQASNGVGGIVIQPFTITVTPAANGPMDFSVAGNIGITAALP